MDKRYIRPQELAQLLSLRIDTVYSWVWQKKIPYFKMGRLVRFDLREIDAWMQEKRVEEIS